MSVRFNGLLEPIPDDIPDELKSIPRWIVWQTDYDKELDKWTKIPRQPRYPLRGASKNNLSHCSDFETAYQSYLQNDYLGGVGFIVTDNDPFTFFDLDRCVNAGVIDDNAMRVINDVYSYAELSPSQKGIRIIALGKLPGKQINNHKLGRELYDGQKNSFLTITGHCVIDQPDIVDAQTEINRYYSEWRTSNNSEAALLRFTNEFRSSVNLDNVPVKTLQLMNGNGWDAYPSRSEVLYGVCLDLLEAELSIDDILTVLTDENFAIAQIAESRRPNNRESQRLWIANYTLSKAKGEHDSRAPIRGVDISFVLPETEKQQLKEQQEANQSPQLFPVPILNEFMEWMESREEYPTRSISMTGVLAANAVLAGRIYQSENSNDSSLYLMTLAQTGRGKGYPGKAIKSLFNAAGYTNLIKGAGNTSASAIFSALREEPCHIQISDEVGKQYAAARKQSNGMLAEAFSQLTIAYSETDSTMLPRNYSTEGLTPQQITQRGNRYVIHPSITLFSFATLEQVFNNLTTDDIDDGFLNRQIIIHADDERLPFRERVIRPPPEHLVKWVKSMRQFGLNASTDNHNMRGFNTSYDEMPSPIIAKLPTDSRKIFRLFKEEAESYENEQLKMTVRWNENAMRLANGLAIAENQRNPVISSYLAEFAIWYIRYHGIRTLKLVDTHIADNEYHRLRNQVYAAILKSGTQGRTSRDLANYCRLWKSSTVTMRDQVIEALRRDDMIVEVKPEKKLGRGRRPTHSSFFATDVIQFND